MSADALEASLAPRFAVRYDELMAQPWVDAFYGGSGFFNTGYWTNGITSPRDACVRLMDELASRLPPAPATLLDVACGFGATTADLARRFPNARITGINLSEGQIARCRERLSSAEFAVMDATALDFEDAMFDAVISVEAAFHFSTRERFFAEAARVLRPGGRLVLSDILYSDPSVVGGWMVPSANRITKLDTYNAQLAAAGFEDIELVDATPECWIAFCRALGTFIGSNDLTDRLERCVAHYVLASASKGCA